jgi:hypothetical protein
LKLKYYILLSSFAMKFSLRHYDGALQRAAVLRRLQRQGGAVQVASIKTRVESTPGFSA